MISISRTRMLEEIKTDNNCIVKAFENNPISILEEDLDNKRVYYFKASDIGKVLDIVNIRTSIVNFDEDEKVVRTTYSSNSGNQDTIFLTSRGVYRLLYSSKKEIAKKFRKWASDILDDIIFNQSKELQRQLEEKTEQLKLQEKKIEMLESRPETEGFFRESGYIYIIKETSKFGRYKIGKSKSPIERISGLNVSSSESSLIIDKQFETIDMECAEKIIHSILKPYRIKKRNAFDIVKDNNDLIHKVDTESLKNEWAGRKWNSVAGTLTTDQDVFTLQETPIKGVDGKDIANPNNLFYAISTLVINN